MFLLKILGSLIIITTSSLIGYIYGSSYSKRVRNLIYLRNCIQLLETEIMYSSTPIPEALKNVFRKGNKEVSFIFMEINEHLLSDRSNSLEDSFQVVCNRYKAQLNFSLEDIEVITSLGNTLGKSDKLHQQKYFKLIVTQLEGQQIDAEEKKKKNEKMYKSLGLLGGLALVILLI